MLRGPIDGVDDASHQLGLQALALLCGLRVVWSAVPSSLSLLRVSWLEVEAQVLVLVARMALVLQSQATVLELALRCVEQVQL